MTPKEVLMRCVKNDRRNIDYIESAQQYHLLGHVAQDAVVHWTDAVDLNDEDVRREAAMNLFRVAELIRKAAG